MVEMGDLDLAGQHLASLQEGPPSVDVQSKADKKLKLMEALVWLRVGDTGSAQACLLSMATSGADSGQDSHSRDADMLDALLKTADGDFASAVDMWTAIAQHIAAKTGSAFTIADRRKRDRIDIHDWSVFDNLLAKSDSEYYVAFQLFADKDGTARIYDETWTGDWWWELQVSLSHISHSSL